MCPLCISTALGIAAGTVTTAGVASLFAFTRRIAIHAEPSADSRPEDETHE
jgi:hypothetical protein